MKILLGGRFESGRASYLTRLWRVGGRCSGKTELNEPIAVVLDYSEKWIVRRRIDPVELVTLRKSGLTCEELAARFGTAKSTISRHLSKAIEGEILCGASSERHFQSR